ncbi:hypothetical protein, partial [Salmonella sp. s54395]
AVYIFSSSFLHCNFLAILSFGSPPLKFPGYITAVSLACLGLIVHTSRAICPIFHAGEMSNSTLVRHDVLYRSDTR